MDRITLNAPPVSTALPDDAVDDQAGDDEEARALPVPREGVLAGLARTRTDDSADAASSNAAWVSPLFASGNPMLQEEEIPGGREARLTVEPVGRGNLIVAANRRPDGTRCVNTAVIPEDIAPAELAHPGPTGGRSAALAGRKRDRYQGHW